MFMSNLSVNSTDHIYFENGVSAKIIGDKKKRMIISFNGRAHPLNIAIRTLSSVGRRDHFSEQQALCWPQRLCWIPLEIGPKQTLLLNINSALRQLNHFSALKGRKDLIEVCRSRQFFNQIQLEADKLYGTAEESSDTQPLGFPLTRDNIYILNLGTEYKVSFYKIVELAKQIEVGKLEALLKIARDSSLNIDQVKNIFDANSDVETVKKLSSMVNEFDLTLEEVLKINEGLKSVPNYLKIKYLEELNSKSISKLLAPLSEKENMKLKKIRLKLPYKMQELKLLLILFNTFSKKFNETIKFAVENQINFAELLQLLDYQRTFKVETLQTTKSIVDLLKSKKINEKQIAKISTYVRENYKGWLTSPKLTEDAPIYIQGEKKLPRNIQVNRTENNIEIYLLFNRKTKNGDAQLGKGMHKTAKECLELQTGTTLVRLSMFVNEPEVPLVNEEFALLKRANNVHGFINTHENSKVRYPSRDGMKIAFMQTKCDEDLHTCIVSGRLLSDREFKLIAQKILRGIKQLHQEGIIHRDIKLENLLLIKNPSGEVVDLKITDLGLRSRVCGTHAYFSPEHCKALCFGENFEMTPLDDAWAAGITLKILWAIKSQKFFLIPYWFSFNNDWKSVIRAIADMQFDPLDQPSTLKPNDTPSYLDIIKKLLEPFPEDRWTCSQALAAMQ